MLANWNGDFCLNWNSNIQYFGAKQKYHTLKSQSVNFKAKIGSNVFLKQWLFVWARTNKHLVYSIIASHEPQSRERDEVIKITMEISLSDQRSNAAAVTFTRINV